VSLHWCVTVGAPLSVTLGERMTTRKNIRVVVSFGCALTLFAVMAGYQEYTVVSDGMQTEDAHGGTRPLTQSEIRHRVFETAGYSLIPGAFGSVLLLLAASGASRFLRRVALPAAIVGSLLFGGMSGLAMSLIGLFLVGGLSPPFVISCVAAGMLSFLLFGMFRDNDDVTQQPASPNAGSGGAPPASVS